MPMRYKFNLNLKGKVGLNQYIKVFGELPLVEILNFEFPERQYELAPPSDDQLNHIDFYEFIMVPGLGENFSFDAKFVGTSDGTKSVYFEHKTAKGNLASLHGSQDYLYICNPNEDEWQMIKRKKVENDFELDKKNIDIPDYKKRWDRVTVRKTGNVLIYPTSGEVLESITSKRTPNYFKKYGYSMPMYHDVKYLTFEEALKQFKIKVNDKALQKCIDTAVKEIMV